MVPAIGPSYRVLVVEDEFLLAEDIAETLRDHGFEVHTFANPDDALTYLAGDDACDVLFTDIDLRNRLDGTALSRLARALRPELAVVYASGAMKTLDKVKAVPDARFIPKPYDPEEVCAVLSRAAATQH